MSLWVKICGNTRLEDALAAAEAGADAVGFVFAPSPRQVTAEAVAQMLPALAERCGGESGPSLERIGVFVEPDDEAIAQIVEQCALTGVQLHPGAGPEDQRLAAARRLRARFGSALRILGAVSYDEAAAAAVERIAAEGVCDAVLVDTKVSGKAGGTGVVFDWSEAARTIFSGCASGCKGSGRNASGRNGLPLVAAGGLRPENVAEAVRLLRPWGVDVASGVELRPGLKDNERIRQFVRQARHAAAETGN